MRGEIDERTGRERRKGSVNERTEKRQRKMDRDRCN
jgi:hypothetical protein